MPAKLVIITGGNSGLGYECAKAILQLRDYTVIIASRNVEASTKAVAELRQTIAPSSNNIVEAMQIDLSSLASVRKFADDFEARRAALPPLHALVLNAGLQFQRHSLSKDGFEETFAVNHLGHFLLANLFLSKFPAQGGRIVFVASGVHDPLQKTGMPDPIYSSAKELAHSKPKEGEPIDTWGRRAYANSKLCNVLCSYELSRRIGQYLPNSKVPSKQSVLRTILTSAQITVTAMDPGLMPGTGLARDYSSGMQFGWNYILPLVRPFMRNAHTIADSGKYIDKRKLQKRNLL